MSGRATIRKILMRWTPVVGVGLLLANCSDQTGPEEQFGQLALLPTFESSAAHIVPVDSLRITLTRSDSITIALDTVIGLAGQDSVDLSLRVTLLAQTETFFLVLKIVNSVGDTVFSAGPQVVTATSGSSIGTPTPVTIVYVGVGSDADSVRITTPGASVLFGDTVLLDAIALDSVGAPIPGTPIRWLSTDEVRGTFPDDEIGKLVGGSTRGSLSVIAELLTGPADTVTVLVQPTPSSIVIVSGDGGRSWAESDRLRPDAGPDVGHSVGIIQPALAELRDGRLLMFLRSTGGAVYRSYSLDGTGLHWSSPEPASLPNPNCAVDLIRLQSGALLLVYNPTRRGRSPLRVALSYDDGATWAAWRDLETEAGEFSYPTAIQTSDGLLHVLYTWRRQTIAHASFEESWVREDAI